MKLFIRRLNPFNVCTLFVIAILVLAIMPREFQTLGNPGMTVTVQTNKPTYLLRQKVLIQGNMLIDGSPASNLVVAVQIEDALGSNIVYRTLQIGTPTQSWPINITNLILLDNDGNPIDTVRAGATVQARIYLHNWQTNTRDIFGTITVFDANMVPIGAYSFAQTMDPLSYTQSSFQFEIPAWACSGRALIVGNVYSHEPRTGGLILSLEKTLYYGLSRTQQGLFGNPAYPTPPPQTTSGTYKTNITLSPSPRQGTYNIYVLAQSSPTVNSFATTTFNVQNSTGYPPQASFVFLPAKVYLNMTVNFDASSSTPEGYNDLMTKYVWDFGDGTPKVTETDPYIAHVFLQARTLTVTLNVTDKENMWCTTKKPMVVLPESGPTAKFSWAPQVPYDNEWVTFNASSSTAGWSAKIQDFAPIQSYKWNFGDGSGNMTTPSKTITHLFGKNGTFTVRLWVTDSVGRIGSTSHIVLVLNSTQSAKTYDVNGDGKIDLKDVFRVGKAYGSRPGDPKWDSPCDFNHDGIIDLKDYYPVCQHYGEDP
jgi:PKD repeat protein